MLRNLKQTLARNISNIPGWRTNRKIVVIESDDWGSIRMPNKDVYEACLRAGYSVDTRPYERFDCLETANDLSALYDVLRRFKDRNGNTPIITANSVVANPDFEKIKRDQFSQYHYELIDSTYKRADSNQDTFGLFKEGISNGFLYPQYHGREHYNIVRWLKLLQDNNEETHFAFNHGLVGLAPKQNPSYGNKLLIALNCNNQEELGWQIDSLKDGANQFERLFGFRPKTFIAPCYTWSREVEGPLFDVGVKLFQGNRVQVDPFHCSKVRRRLGEYNAAGQCYSVRNAFFEPSIQGGVAVGECMKDIRSAFFWNKPAIISSHRINYVGSLDIKNRERNLIMLGELLKGILHRYPDVEFMSSNQFLSELAV